MFVTNLRQLLVTWTMIQIYIKHFLYNASLKQHLGRYTIVLQGIFRPYRQQAQLQSYTPHQRTNCQSLFTLEAKLQRSQRLLVRKLLRLSH